MASISLLLFGTIAVLAGFFYFYYKKHMNITGSIMVTVIGLVGLYLAVTFCDIILAGFGFETGFPKPETGYYLYQAMSYIILGIIFLGSHFYLLRETSSKEISHAFWWVGAVLLIVGGLDLLVDIFLRIPVAELRFFIALLVLAVLVFVATKYRDTIFGKKAKGEQ
jgi:hypothetical protein